MNSDARLHAIGGTETTSVALTCLYHRLQNNVATPTSASGKGTFTIGNTPRGIGGPSWLCVRYGYASAALSFYLNLCHYGFQIRIWAG